MKVGYVALIGRPNVGNTLLGQKIAIISDNPHTSRMSLLWIKTTEKGQIIFIDNPGIHKPLHTLNKRMMSFVYSALQTSNLICLLIDATQPFGHGDEFVIETLKKVTTPLFLLINKVDIVKKDKILPIIDRYKDLLNFKEIIPVSALKGTNLDVLEKQIYENLPEAEKLYDDDTISDQSLRFMVAEIVREKLLKRVEKELPFVTAVLVEEMEERQKEAELEGEREAEVEAATEDAGAPGAGSKTKKQARKLTYISATIFVERDGHRKIVIGRHGQVIKEIGIDARREIEQLIDSKVFLDLTVKVRERWRDSAEVLDLIEGQK